MKKFKIRLLKPKNAPQLAKIHLQALAGDFLPSLGLDFLTLFYQIGLKHHLLEGFAAEKDNQIIGFIVATPDSTNLMKKFVTKRPFSLMLKISKAIVNKPKIILNLCQTVFYSQKSQSQGINAELLVIAVKSGWRHQGIGQQLIVQLEDYFQKKRVSRYHLSVYADNRQANRFYQKLGFKKAKSFELYGKMWRSYVKKTNPKH